MKGLEPGTWEGNIGKGGKGRSVVGAAVATNIVPKIRPVDFTA